MRRRGGILQDGAPVYSIAAEKSSGPLTRPALEDLARTPLLLRQGGGDDGHGIGPQNLILWGPSFFSLLGTAKLPLRQGFSCGKTLVRAARAPSEMGPRSIPWPQQKSSGPLTRPALEDLAETPLLLRQGGGDNGHGIGPQNLILRGPVFLHCSGRQSRPSAKVFPAEKRLSVLRAPHRRWGPGLFHGHNKKTAGLFLK